MNALSDNAAALELELAWLAQLIDASIRLYFGQECEVADVRDIAAPDLSHSSSSYAQVVREHAMSFEARVVLILALAPHVRPQLLDPFLTKNPNFERGFTGIAAVRHVGPNPQL